MPDSRHAKDGLYQATLYRSNVVAGFTLKGGRVVDCAPILKRQVNTDGRMSHYVMERSVLVEEVVAK